MVGRGRMLWVVKVLVIEESVVVMVVVVAGFVGRKCWVGG